MHSPFINSQIDRVLALGILLISLTGGYIFTKYVYLDQLLNFSYEMELMKKKNAKIDSILAEEKDLRDKITQQKYKNDKNKIFLNSNKSSTAASELQNYLKKLIAKNSKAKILAIKPFPIMEYDNYSEASLEIRIKDIVHKELHKVLFMIESKSPVLLIKELDIKRTQLQYKSLVNSKEKQPRLDVIIVVSGFFRELPEEVKS